jgi:alpha-1,3-rhamnosyl/mannosyltransferase
MTGHWRVWQELPRHLANRVTLELVQPGAISRADARADVWLADGHSGLLPVDRPVVAAVHEVGWTTPELRSFMTPDIAAAFSRSTASAVSGAAHVVTPSEWTRREVTEAYGTPKERVHTIPYGVDLEVFRPNLPGASSLISTGSKPASAYVLFAGNVGRRKNVEVVRHAVTRLARRGFEHLLVLVATGGGLVTAEAAERRRMAEAELPGAPGRVVSITTPGDRALAALMAGAAAVCVPSYVEGFGLTALEAMACGVPVVTSDRTSLPEVVASAGLVVPPTADAFEDALLRVLSDPDFAHDLGRRARARAELFSWQRTADRWAMVLERAAAGG